MRISFMGSPEFAATVLDGLAREHDVVSVYTMPDKVRGRGRKRVPTPVKEKAQELGIPVREPATLRDPEVIRELSDDGVDAVCVAAYGRILPEEVLAIPEHGCINVHASLLPRHRGAAPIERAILEGDSEAGVSIMRMDTGLDTGDYCMQASLDPSGMSADELTGALAEIGRDALLRSLEAMEEGTVSWTSQPEEGVTYAEKLSKGELDLEPAETASMNVRRVLASGARHPSRVRLGDVEMTVISAAIAERGDPSVPDPSEGAPGDVVATRSRLFLRSSDGWLEVKRLKPAGRKEMDAKAFLAGARSLDEATWGAFNGA